MWRESHPAPDDAAQTRADVCEALADMQAGDTGRPVEEIDTEIRAKYFAQARA
jgi:hypothetical protein